MNFCNFKKLINLRKTNLIIKNNEKQNIESPKQKVKAPNNRPNTAPSSKKPPHRTFSNSSKKPGKQIGMIVQN